MRRIVVAATLLCLAALPVTDAAADPISYIVEPGDILGAIAEEHDVSVSDLRRWNDLDDDMLQIGQELTIVPEDASSPAGSGGDVYVVSSGDTVGAIASRHDCSVDDILAWNPGLNPDRISIGQELAIGFGGRQRRRIEYEVQPGDFLGRIADRHSVTVSDILSWNSGLDPDRIRIGEDIVIMLNGGANSASIGRPNDGELVEGEQLPGHRLYQIRDVDRAWGTNETIGWILDGFDHVNDEFPGSPRVRMHDLSNEDGGRMRGHRSHQSGRDADIGYWQEGCSGVCRYEPFDADELDVERTWELLSYWIENDLVEYVFIDYSYQRELYQWLEEEGESERNLRRWFQYPRGRDVARGILRHERNHADHMHVRFSCPGGDDRCR